MTTAPPPTTTVRIPGEDHDSTIDAHELFSARRALALLKARLGHSAMLNLLAPDILLGDDFLRNGAQASEGQQLEGSITLEATGITALAFTSWLSGAFAREDVMLAGHPEHYVIHGARGTVNIVETLGDHVCSFFMKEWDASLLPFAASEHEAALSPGRRSFLTLGDGTIVGTIRNHFEDTANGMLAHLSVALPRACGQSVVQQHLEHFAVEFRTWILRAAAELRSTPV